MNRKLHPLLRPRVLRHLCVGIGVAIGLLGAESYGGYLLFHCLVEFFSIVVAFGIFTIFWNARRFLDNGCFLFLGVAYFFVGGIDLLHTLAYDGMGVFPSGSNLATQLWICGRGVESLSLLAAPLFLHRRFSAQALFAVYAVVVCVLLLSIFSWKLFPVCFVEETGLTPFKLASEYVICLILIASLALLFRHRKELDSRVYRLFSAAILLTIAAEVAFTTYQGVTDVGNEIGHFFKLASFYLVYVAFIEVGLTNPYAVLFRDLKESEESLRRSESRFRGTFDNAAVGIAHVDLNGRWLLVNDRLCEMLGYSRDEILQKTLQDLTHSEDRAGDMIQFSSLVQGEVGNYRREQRYLRREDRIIWVNLTMALQRDPRGNPLYAIAIIEDITQRKEAERQLQAVNETLEDQVAERTALAEKQATQLRALTSELTLAEQRERRRLGQILHDHLQQLLVAAKLKVRMLHRRFHNQEPVPTLQQVDELLDQAIDASRSLTVELSPPILYDGGLAAALEWLARQMEEKHDLKVKVNVAGADEPKKEDLRVIIFQAVRELLFNVVKHAGADSARLEMTRTEDGRLKVSVADNGVGFDPSSLEVREVADAGFGLFSIRERLHLLGGRLEIESTPGRGACVSIYVPQRPLPESAARLQDVMPAISSSAAPGSVAEQAPPPRAAAGQPIRVLLVDDHELVREGLASLLQDHSDIEVVGEARDGRAACELALQTRPDVVVMDVAMPRLNGMEATRNIRAAMPYTNVIGLSMHDEEEMGDAMRQAGAFAYLAKDGPADELVAAIRAAASTCRPRPDGSDARETP